MNFTYSPPGYLASRQLGTGELSWLSLDWDTDRNTGTPLASRDPSGVLTTYTYDQLGRLTQITPSLGEEPTTISFPDVLQTTVRQGTFASGNLLLSNYSYDTLGRLTEVRKRNYDDFLVGQKTTYDDLGNITAVSEWVSLDTQGNFPTTLPQTTFNYQIQPGEALFTGIPVPFDPFGRVHKIVTADAKETLTEYLGLSTTVTVKNVRGSDGAGLEVWLNPQTTYTKDILGRLAAVDSPEEAADAIYRYDSRGNLTEVELNAPDGTRQERFFEYDALNRLRRATNLENGTTLYEAYDPTGNLLQFRDAENQVFSNEYDAAGRKTHFRAGPSPTGTLLTELIYDETGGGPEPPRGSSQGKLTTVKSYDDSGTPVHTRKHFFEGLNGRMSREETVFPDWNTTSLPVVYSYNPFGLLEQLTYPDEGVRGTQIRDLLYTYSNGFLTKVENQAVDPSSAERVYVEEIKYNPAGGIQEILTSGNVRTITTPDSLNRPQVITIQSEPQVAALSGGGSEGNQQVINDFPFLASPRFIGDIPTCQVDCGGGPPPPPPPPQPNVYYQSGTYIYDGAGNIVSIGVNDYFYDEVNRLQEAYPWFKGTSYGLKYSYDPFGNMTKRIKQVGAATPTTQSFFVDPQTNRIGDLNGVPFAYDPNGNLLNDGEQEYLFDSRNRLLKVTQPATGQEFGPYGYDATGYRVTKDGDGARSRIYYLRNGSGQVLSEFQKPLEGSGSPVWNKDYIYTGGRLLALIENDTPKTPVGLRACGLPTCTKLNGEVINNGANQVTLYWEPSDETDLGEYEVYLKGSGPTWDPIGNPVSAEFLDNLAMDGQTRKYKVATIDTAFNISPLSGEIKVVVGDSDSPAPPTGLNATASDGTVNLTWTASPDEGGGGDKDVLGYAIYRKTNLTGAYPSAAITSLPVTGTSFHDFGLQNLTTYYYEVKTLDTAGNYSPGIEVNAIPFDNVPPSPPGGVVVISGCNPTPPSLTIFWNLNPASEGVWKYQIFKVGNENPIGEVFYPGSEFEDSDGLSEGTPFTYKVLALDSAGNPSGDSEEVIGYLRNTSLPPVVDSDFTVTPRSGRVDVSWLHPTDTPPEIIGYNLYRRRHTIYGNDCNGYERIATEFVPSSGPPPGGYIFTDYSVLNFNRYDYKLTSFNATNEESIDTFFNGEILPLEAPSNLHFCGYWFDTWGWGKRILTQNRNPWELQENSPWLLPPDPGFDHGIQAKNYYTVVNSSSCNTNGTRQFMINGNRDFKTFGSAERVNDFETLSVCI